MRILKLTLLIAAALTAVSCNKDEDKDLAKVIVGTWSLDDYKQSTKSIVIGHETISVELSFFEDRTFVLKQKVGADVYQENFSGEWSLNGDELSGVYSDKNEWGETYKISFQDNDNVLQMETLTDHDMFVYKRTE